MNHTPTPWELKNYANGDVVEIQGLRDGIFVPIAAFRVADVGQWQKENAAFIVRAVNAHDELLKCAKTFRRFILSFYEGEDDDMAPTDTLKAVEIAIAKAESR